MLCTIDRTVLSTRTSETDHERGESPAGIGLHGRFDESIDMFEERLYLPLLLEKIDDRLIFARQIPVLRIPAGVVGSTAVENEAAAVAGIVFRDAFFE